MSKHKDKNNKQQKIISNLCYGFFRKHDRQPTEEELDKILNDYYDRPILREPKSGTFPKIRKKRASKKSKKIPGMNRHHWLNKCHGGSYAQSNISYLNIEKHNYWHRVFKNLNLEEAIELLIRMKRMKDSQKPQLVLSL